MRKFVISLFCLYFTGIVVAEIWQPIRRNPTNIVTATTTTTTGWQIPQFANSILKLEFNEDTNNAGYYTDSSSVSNCNGERRATTWVAGSNGMSANISIAANQFVVVTNSSSNAITQGKMTACVWAKDNVTGNRAIFGRWTTATAGDQFTMLSEGGWYGLLKKPDNNNVSTTPKATPYDNWTLWTLTHDGTNVNYYHNKKLIGNIACVGLSNVTTAPIILGKLRPDDNVYAYAGNVDFACVWTNGLSETEVTNLFDNTKNGHGWSNSVCNYSSDIYSNIVAEYQLDYNYPADTAFYATNNLNNTVGAIWLAYSTGQGCYYFDGIDDKIDNTDTKSIPITTQFSVSMWLNMVVTATNGQLYYPIAIDDSGSEGGNGDFTINVGGIIGAFTNVVAAFDLRSGNSYAMTVSNVIPFSLTNQWVHLAVTYDQTNTPAPIAIYINSTNQTMFNQGFTNVFSGCARIQLGNRFSPLTYYKGWIDEVIIGNRPLTASQILTLYQQGKVRH